MKVFLTGATGYVGSVVAEKLQKSGHSILALARSEASADLLKSRNMEILQGDLSSVESHSAAIRSADAVIHTAFDFGGGDFGAGVKKEVAVVRAFLKSLEGTDKPLIITSGTAILGDSGDRTFDEDTVVETPPESVTQAGGMAALMGRIAVEKEVLTAKGVHGIVLRPPNVYGRNADKSIFTYLRHAGQALGAVPYAIGTAEHKWSVVYVDDLADLFVLALAKAKRGELFQAAAQSGLETKAIAEAISTGAGLGGKTVELDIDALSKALGFPPLADYWAMNFQSSGEKARQVLGWRPQHVDLLNELRHPQTAATPVLE